MTGEASRINTDFFITYHHNDEMAARWIASVLKQARFSTLSDSWDFLSGEAPIKKIEYMFTAAQNVMVLISDRFLQANVDLTKSFGKSRNPFSKGFLVAEGKVIIIRIEACDIEAVLGPMEYLDLAGIDAKEAEKRLLAAVGGGRVEQKVTEPLPVSAKTREELLVQRKQEMDQLLVSTIKHNYHMKLDLEQEVEKEIEVKNERTGEMEKWKQCVWESVPLDTVLKDGKNYILVNPSGMGKTTFLTYAACALLGQEAHFPFLPLFFTCIGLNNRAGTIEDFIWRQVDSVYAGTQGTLVSGEWENLCILLDALDQARDVDDIVLSLLLQDKPFHYKKAKIIISSRQNTADKVKEEFAKIRLKLPEAEEVQHYLGEENYKKLAGIIQASGELVKAPVLLEMLKTITEKGHVVSTLFNRADLYTEFTKVLLDQERSKPRFWQDRLSIRHFIDFELEQVLEKIAFFSLADNEILEIPKEKLVQYCESPEKKESLLNIGILLELFEDREQKIVFRHQSFHAYFAARYIYYRQPELFQELTSDIAFFYNDVWYEVMRFFIGFEKDKKKAEVIIDTIYKIEDKKVELNHALRLNFAVLLMSEAQVSGEYVQLVYIQLRDLLKNNKNYWNFFNTNIDKFNKSNDVQRKSIFFTFVALTLLRDTDSYVRSAVAEALGKILTVKDIALLEPLLRNESSDVRYTAIKIMENIGTSTHIPLLEPLLRDEDRDVSHAAAETLGNIVKSGDIPILEPLLRDEDSYVRLAAIKALEKIATLKDICILEPLFNDENHNVRRAVTEALEYIFKDKNIPLLTKDAPPSISQLRFTGVRSYSYSRTTEAFENIGSVKKISLLEPLLSNEDWSIRLAAVKVLMEISTSKDIPLLEPLLSDWNYDLRHFTAEAIEQIYKRSTPVLRLDRILPSKKEEKILPVKLFSGQALHILHISDIHYAIKNDPTITCIFHEFLEDINKWRSQQNHTNIQAICLTGDIAASGQTEQYDAIHEKITALLETTCCPKENLFIIPGNHDVQEYEKISDQGKSLMEQARENKINVDTGVLSSADHYRLFHDKFANYYKFIAKYEYVGSQPDNRHPIPNLPNPWFNRKLKDFPVRILGLNSALFCLKGYIDYGKIRMGTHQFQEAYFQGKGQWKGKAGDSCDPEVVILLTHHPLNWLAESEYDEYSTLLERYAVLHLHGHIHKTKIVKEQKLFSSSGGYVSIGTGSLYGEKGKVDVNTYHIITLDFENQEVHVWARRWNPDTGKWTVYDDDGNNRFRLPVTGRRKEGEKVRR